MDLHCPMPLFSLGASITLHYDPAKITLPPAPKKKIYQPFLQALDKVKTDIEDLQKERFTANAIVYTLSNQKIERSKAERCWDTLGLKVTLWALA